MRLYSQVIHPEHHEIRLDSVNITCLYSGYSLISTVTPLYMYNSLVTGRVYGRVYRVV